MASLSFIALKVVHRADLPDRLVKWELSRGSVHNDRSPVSSTGSAGRPEIVQLLSVTALLLIYPGFISSDRYCTAVILYRNLKQWNETSRRHTVRFPRQ